MTTITMQVDPTWAELRRSDPIPLGELLQPSEILHRSRYKLKWPSLPCPLMRWYEKSFRFTQRNIQASLTRYAKFSLYFFLVANPITNNAVDISLYHHFEARFSSGRSSSPLCCRWLATLAFRRELLRRKNPEDIRVCRSGSDTME